MTDKTFALEPIEKASVDELRALQLQRLKWSLAHAYANSPVYKAKFDKAGVHPDDLQQLSDLSKFPFTTKKDLRDSYPFGMFAVPRGQLARIHAPIGLNLGSKTPAEIAMAVLADILRTRSGIAREQL